MQVYSSRPLGRSLRIPVGAVNRLPWAADFVVGAHRSDFEVLVPWDGAVDEQFDEPGEPEELGLDGIANVVGGERSPFWDVARRVHDATGHVARLVEDSPD